MSAYENERGVRRHPIGFKRIFAGEDYMWAWGKNPQTDSPAGARAFTNYVKDLFYRWWDQGWTDTATQYMAAECQDRYAGAREFWVWEWEGEPGKLEILFYGDPWVDTPAKLQHELNVHRGFGWHFPLMVIFPEHGATQELIGLCREAKVPYDIDPITHMDVPGGGEEPPQPPPPPTSWETRWVEAGQVNKRWPRLAARLDVLFRMLLELVGDEEEH